MFKKSLVLSIAVLLTAVLFVFTGCEGPAGPIGQTGNDGSDVPFPGEIKVSYPESGPPELPAGVTYPPLSGAKILSGNAADISKAFNGGILVANTPDSGALGTGTTNEGTVYAQDAVDYVVWTGPGLDATAPVYQGAIVVPPGKTLFIAAPLYVASAANSFVGITVSDKGTFVPTAAASVQAATGGTTVDQNSPEGKIVILNGGSIRGTAGDITIGGTLEIHHGAYISVGGAAFLGTPKSTIDVYGSITGATEGLRFEGDLIIKGGGIVTGSNDAVDIDIFGRTGTVTVESYGTLQLGDNNGTVHFEGPVTVNENASLKLYTDNPGDDLVTFHDVTTISGILDAQYNAVTVLPAGHLKITATGEIIANAWAQVNNGTDVSLLAAIAPGAAPSALNNYTTIDIPTEGKVTFRVGEIRATSYANLVLLAAHPSLSLRASPFAVSQGVVAFYGTSPNEFVIVPTDVPLVVSSNDVTLTNYPLVTDLTVGEGRTLTLSGTLASAGEITVLGTFNAGSASFAAKLDKLTVGSDTVKAPELTLGSAEFNADPTEIIVNSGSSLILGGGTTAVNPAGTIFLDDNASLSVASTSGATLARLRKLTIDPGASFTSVSTDVTFAGLEELTVDGTLTALLHSTDPKFSYLETNSKDEAGKGEVGGGGAAVFSNWAVDGDDNKHAFDQLLAIRDLTVESIVNVANTSGGGSLQTPDAGSPTGSNIILRVTDITAPAGGLTIDRDLNVRTGGTIEFATTENTVTINAGSRILVGNAVAAASLGNPGLSATAPAVLVAGTSSPTVLTETNGALVVSADTVRVQAGSTLNVDGTLTAGAAGAEILAGLGDNEITLVNGSSLTKGVIKSNAAASGNATAEITVNATGVLAIADDSTVEMGSSVKILASGSITTAATTALTFGTSGASIGEATTSTPGELSAISESIITADGNDDGYITITGALRASKGSSILTGATGKEINLTGSVTLRNAGTAYDSLTLTGAKLAEGVVFNADDALIDLTGTLTGLGNGSISTKGITAGKGALNIGAVAVLTATGTSAQSLSGVILNGTAGSLTGNLSLGTGSTLALSGNLLVGTHATGTTTPGTISVGTGTITLANASSIITLAQLGTGGSGTLSFNTYSLKGVASGGPALSDTTASTVPSGSTITLTNSDIAGAFGRGILGTLDGQSVAAVVTGGDAILITGKAGGNTISGTSKLYSSD